MGQLFQGDVRTGKRPDSEKPKIQTQECVRNLKRKTRGHGACDDIDCPGKARLGVFSIRGGGNINFSPI